MGIEFTTETPLHAVGPVDEDINKLFQYIDLETRQDCQDWYGFKIDTEWYCYRITDLTIRGIIEALMIDMSQNGPSGAAKRIEFDFFGMFWIFVSNRKSTGEKEGNINISFQAGDRAYDLISTNLIKGKPEEKYNMYEHFRIEVDGASEETVNMINHTYMVIAKKICQDLSSKYKIVIPDKLNYVVYAVTEIFVTNIFRKLLFTLGEDQEKKLASLNFNNLIEFHAQREDDDSIKLLMRPGSEAKQGIKNDAATEQEFEDD